MWVACERHIFSGSTWPFSRVRITWKHQGVHCMAQVHREDFMGCPDSHETFALFGCKRAKPRHSCVRVCFQFVFVCFRFWSFYVGLRFLWCLSQPMARFRAAWPVACHASGTRPGPLAAARRSAGPPDFGRTCQVFQGLWAPNQRGASLWGVVFLELGSFFFELSSPSKGRKPQ